MGKRVKAQVTVYAALSVLLVMTLICTCIRSAAVSASQVRMETAAVLSMEAVFAEYSNPLLKEFDIFALKESAAIQPLFQQYVTKNITGDIQPQVVSQQGTEVLSARLDNYIYMTDEKGACINNEILSFMKCGIYEEMLGKTDEIKEQQKKSEALKAVTDAVADCETAFGEQESCVLGIIASVEGLVVDNNGMAGSGEFFVKAMLSAPLSMQSAGISNSVVYQTMEKNAYYMNGVGLVCDMEENLTEYQQLFTQDEMCSEQERITYAQEYQAYYEKNQKALFRAVGQTDDKLKEALEQIVQYEAKADGIKKQIENCKELLLQKRSDIGEESYEAIAQDIGIMQEQQEGKTALCDMNALKAALEKRQRCINAVQEFQKSLEQPLQEQQCSQMIQDLELLKAVMEGIDNTGLTFDYSNIQFSKEKNGLKKVKELCKKMEDGIMGLVVENDNFSEKEISIDDLADVHIGQTQIQNVETENNNLLYNEYLFMKFASYTDYYDKEGNFSKDSGKLLDYMLEYILYGKKSDKENLKSSIKELSLLREGVNLAYLFTDSAKKKEAEALAVAFVGFTGNMAAVKAAQYLIMGAWAYGESILELKQLYRGEKVEFVKNKENWKLSLEGLMNMDFEKTSDKEERKENQKGVSYEEYLRLFFLVEHEEKKYYRTMAAMELRMMELGDTQFRMKNYIYGAESSVLYRTGTLKQYYERRESYYYG